MLLNIQKQFLEALFNSDPRPEILSFIDNSGSRSAVDQFQSYRDSVTGSINGALAISYPVVKKLVGEDFFNHITQQYIQQQPSTSPDLNNYGDNFSDFIKTLKNLETVPYLSDVAKLEWAWQKIINGSQSEPGNLESLSHLNEHEIDNVVLTLSPHASLLQSDYAINTIWEMNQDDVNTDIAIDCNNKVNLLIWRNGLDMNITVINDSQFYFLDLTNQSLTFTTVCEQHQKHFPDDDITTLLSNAIQSNWIHSFSLNP